MKYYVFCLLCFIVTLVASNPAAQRLPPQQRQYNNPVQYQSPASQTRPTNQNVKVQNQTPNLGNFDGTKLNDLLMTKILGNPSLQKIMDPNTKLYKQNGQEIHRQPNPGVPPSVVNNYFIVPPEFFTIKNNKTGSKPKNKARAQSNSTQNKTPKKIAEIKTKPKANSKSKVNNDVEIINQNGRSKKAKKKSAQAKSAKLVKENSKSKTKNNDENLQTLPKKTKRRTKQNESTKSETSTPPNEDKKVDIQKDEAVSSEIKTTPTKRRRKTKIKPETVETVTKNTTEAQDLPPNLEIINTPVIEKPVQQEIVSKLAKLIEEPVNDTPLKRIEPVGDKKEISEDSQLSRPSISIDNSLKSKAVKSEETKNSQIQRSSKATTAVSGQYHKNSPVPDDYLKNYFPYMYMGNNFYPNSNNPFDFEQFYHPYLNNNNSKNNRTKSNTRKSTNVKNKEPLPNALDVKLKQRKQNVTTTSEKPISTVMIEDFSSDTSAESIEQISETKIVNFINRKQTEQKHESSEVTNMEINEHEFPLEKSNESSEETMQPEFTLPKQVTTASRTSLEMPPTVLEDLHDFNMPELGREDIMPTAHTNGIIADYYPIFNDDPYYANEGKFFLGELEDERHFYTTDRGFEDLNRERRKFDQHEDYLNSNVDFVDRVNFRRAFKYRERDKPKHEYDNTAIKDTNEQLHTKEVHKIIVQSEKMIEKNETNPEIITEDQFQTPPLLENPDFQTRPIERLSPVFDPNIHYTKVTDENESTEIEPEEPIHSHIDTKPIKYNRLVFDTDFDDENKVSYIDNFKVSTTKKPINDRIETVFAKSRVVKYGVANDEDDVSEHLTVRENGDKFYGDGQTTYVLAKSLGKPEDYFW